MVKTVQEEIYSKNLATKQDVLKINQDVSRLEKEIAEIRKDMQRLEGNMKDQEIRLIKWVVATGVVSVLVMVSLLKLIH